MKYFTSDWHLSHNGILEFSKRPFENVEQMDNTIINNVLATVEGGDEIYFLGDLTWNHLTAERFFRQLPDNINFHWILGNHEKGWQRYRKNCTSISYMKEVTINKHPVILCHYPMLTWNKSHYNSWHLFGHHHYKSNGWRHIEKMTKGKMLNVNVEFNDYQMWSENQIEKYMNKRKDNWDYIKKD
jgi:calcineurin-like phosphoesterase family protein